MNIDDLLQSLPSREDIAKALGGRNSGMSGWTSSSSTTSDLLPLLGIFGTGLLFGAGLAMLLTPKTGRELRRELSEKMGEYGNQARHMAEEAADSATHMASSFGGAERPGQQQGMSGSGGSSQGGGTF